MEPAHGAGPRVTHEAEPNWSQAGSQGLELQDQTTTERGKVKNLLEGPSQSSGNAEENMFGACVLPRFQDFNTHRSLKPRKGFWQLDLLLIILLNLILNHPSTR